MNPWFMAYSNLTGMLDVAKPGAIIVTGRGNRYDPQFQEARKRGAKVYVYWNVLSCPDDLRNPQDQEQFLIDGAHPPLWPFPTPGVRSNWPGTHLLDTRPGSKWLQHIVPLTVDLVNRKLYDGFFMDTLGAQPWAADYRTWPMDEQVAWTTCATNIARELMEAIRAANEFCEIVHNNLWVMAKTHPAAAIALKGELYCNGICFENPPPGAGGVQPNPFHVSVASHTFGLQPRRVLAVHDTDENSLIWAGVPGITHVCSVEKAKGETYAKVTPPVVPYEGWPPSELEQQNAILRQRIADLTAQNATLTIQLNDAMLDKATLRDEITRLEGRIDRIHVLSAPVGVVA